MCVGRALLHAFDADSSEDVYCAGYPLGLLASGISERDDAHYQKNQVHFNRRIWRRVGVLYSGYRLSGKLNFAHSHWRLLLLPAFHTLMRHTGSRVSATMTELDQTYDVVIL